MRVARGGADLDAQLGQRLVVGRQLQHGFGAVQQQAQPERAVVQALRGHDVRGLEPSAAATWASTTGLGAERLSGGAAKARRFVPGSRRIFTRPTLHSCTMKSLACGCPPASSQLWQLPSVGWPAKGQLAARREDAHAVVGRGVGGRQQESRFGQVGPFGKALHRGVVQAAAVHHHGQGVAEVRGGREHVDLLECALLHGLLKKSFGQDKGRSSTPRVAGRARRVWYQRSRWGRAGRAAAGRTSGASRSPAGCRPCRTARRL
jgi:hypothetical protein